MRCCRAFRFAPVREIDLFPNCFDDRRILRRVGDIEYHLIVTVLGDIRTIRHRQGSSGFVFCFGRSQKSGALVVRGQSLQILVSLDAHDEMRTAFQIESEIYILSEVVLDAFPGEIGGGR